MFQLIEVCFRVKLKPFKAYKIKKIYGGGLPAYEKCRSLWLPY